MHGVKSASRNAILGTFILLSCSVSARDASQIGFSELVIMAEDAVKSGTPGEAIPLLTEIVNRAESLDGKDAQRSVQTARLQLASKQLEAGNWMDAKKSATDYLNSEFVQDEHTAVTILCESALHLKDWGALLENANKLVEMSDALKKRVPAHQYLLRGLFYNKRYEEALLIVDNLLEWESDPIQVSGIRGLQIESLVELGRMDSIMALLPELFPNGDHSNLRLNLTLLGIGDKLFDRGDYRNAVAIYRQVLPWVKPMAQVSEMPFSFKNSDVRDLKNVVSNMRDGSQFDIHVSYRMAQSYAKIERYWEAITMFDRTYRVHGETNEGKASFLQKVLLLFEQGYSKEAILSCVDYLESGESDFYARMVCTRLAQHYLNNQNYNKVLALGDYVSHWGEPKDDDERDQATNLMYIFAFVHFHRHDFEEAISGFNSVIKYDPDSERSKDSHYWIGMCHLLGQNYKNANIEFVNYRDSWPEGSFASACLYRSGVCAFGLEDYEKAKEIFKDFISTYPDDELMPDSLSMYGDLLGAEGNLEDAISFYERAVELTGRSYQFESDEKLRKGVVTAATYATVQAIKIFDQQAEAFLDVRDRASANEYYGEIVKWTARYINLFGADSDISQITYWNGRAELARGNTAKALDAYLDTVVRFGSDPSEEGVASILFEFADIIKKLDSNYREQIIAKINDVRETDINQVLKIRLDVLLAELSGGQYELSLKLLDSDIKWKNVPPTGLSLICSAMLGKGEFDRAQEMFDLFEANYDMSPYMVSAYELLAVKMFDESNFELAYELANKALGYYGANKRTGWAQLMKGKIEFDCKQFEEAAKSFNAILGVSEWKGAVSAEAMFLLATTLETQGDLKKAFAFYQRTYLLYKTYNDGNWAADSYLRSAKILKKLGRKNDAQNTYRAMLLDEYVRDLPQARKAIDNLGPAESKELLSGLKKGTYKVTMQESSYE